MSNRKFVLPFVATASAVAIVLSLDGTAVAAQPRVGLATAGTYAVLAGTTVTNTGPSVISGNVGVSPGTAVTGFPPGIVNAGTIHAADAQALQAKDDLTTAYDDAAGRGPVVDVTSKNLGGRTLVPGVYSAASEMALTGTVRLDAQGDPDAVFVFQAGSTLITATSSRVLLVGDAQACRVFWQVGSSATIGTTTRFVGSVLARASIAVQTGATVEGRMLARDGAVTLDSNTITRPFCSAPVATPSVSPSASPSASSAPSGGPSSGATSTPTSTPSFSTPAGPGGPGGDTPIPTGHPHTGQVSGLPGGTGWLMLGLVCFAGAGVAAVRGTRRTDLPES